MLLIFESSIDLAFANHKIGTGKSSKRTTPMASRAPTKTGNNMQKLDNVASVSGKRNANFDILAIVPETSVRADQLFRP